MSLLTFEFRGEIQLLLFVLVCLAAFRWGGRPERIIAVVWIIAVEVIDRLYHVIWTIPYQLNHVDLFHAILDGTVFISLLLVALNANRFYPLWIAAFQLLSVTAHVARELADAISPVAYAVMVVAPSWGILLSLIFGLIAHVRRERKYGAYRDWRVRPDDIFIDYDRKVVRP